MGNVMGQRGGVGWLGEGKGNERQGLGGQNGMEREEEKGRGRKGWDG